MKNGNNEISFVTMGQKIKTEKIWLCKSVGKLKGIGKQGEVKMNEINIHTITDFQRYVRRYVLPKLSIHGLGKKLQTCTGSSTQETNAFRQRPQESKKSLFIKIWREMGREVKVIILHVKILLYH